MSWHGLRQGSHALSKGRLTAQAILLDVEGTTTPVAFVYERLFPFARGAVRDFLARRAAETEVAHAIGMLRAERAAETDAAPDWADSLAAVVAYVHWLMDRDRKSTGLKALQGLIWDEGYRNGALHGEVYPDVKPALERWTGDGRRVAIFSSGSVLAQRLLFAHTSEGDLTPLLSAHFDTAVGAKNDPKSYRAIAEALRCDARAVLFVSDVARELDAAREAGMQTRLCAREPDASPLHHAHAAIRTFAEI